MAEICSPKLETLTNVIKSLLIREGDIIGQNFRKYYEIAKDVYRDLNLYAVRTSKRYLIEIDPNTNSVAVPNDLILISSVSIIDNCGQIVPLILNRNLSDEYIDINLDKDCDCTCNCKDQLCGLLKNYEVVYTDQAAPMPDGSIQVFRLFSRKTIYPNGDYYREWNEPVALYEDGVHTQTVLTEYKEFICKLIVKPCGCVKDCAENRQNLSDCCGTGYLVTECGCNCCPPDFPCETYGMTQMGDRIYFNSNADFTHVLVRGFVDNDINSNNEIMIPLVAKTALLRGIKFEQLTYEKGLGYTAMAIQRQLLQFERLFKEERKRLFRLLNRWSLKEFYETVVPVRRYPHTVRRIPYNMFFPANNIPIESGICNTHSQVPPCNIQKALPAGNSNNHPKGGTCSR
jgi:hypothetical protein